MFNEKTDHVKQLFETLAIPMASAAKWIQRPKYPSEAQTKEQPLKLNTSAEIHFYRQCRLWHAKQQNETAVPDRMTVLTLLIPACSVRAVSACLYTVLIISLSWMPPPQWTSFPQPSGHTASRDVSHTACSYLQLFGTYSHIQTHTLREWCQFGVLNESRRKI